MNLLLPAFLLAFPTILIASAPIHHKDSVYSVGVIPLLKRLLFLSPFRIREIAASCLQFCALLPPTGYYIAML